MMKVLSTLFLLLSAASESSAQDCSMCATADAVISNPNKIIPFLGLSGQDNPTCQQVFDFAPQITDDATCTLVSAHASFCGCPEGGGPINACSLCPDGPGSSPGVPDFTTPFGDSCGELDEYISYLPASECETDRVKLMKRNNWLCKCPNAVTACSMCPDGTVELGNEDLVIPFFNTPNNKNPTCREVRNYASLEDGLDEDFKCSLVQQQAGYCGCPGYEPLNVCSFCEGGAEPEKLGEITPTTDTCDDLNKYVSHFDQEACDGGVSDSVLAMSYFCGCPGAEPNCELCPGDSEMIDPTLDSGSNGLTCGDLETVVSTLTEKVCTDKASTVEAGRAVCCTSGSVSYGVYFSFSVISFVLTLLF